MLHEDEMELLKLQMQAVGEVKGRADRDREIAVKAFKQGFTVEQVAKLTGLSKKVVEKLK